MLSIIKNIHIWHLKDELWSVALDTFATIMENGKLNELEQLLEELYPAPTDITQINDLLWFESAFIFGQLGIQENQDCQRRL